MENFTPRWITLVLIDLDNEIWDWNFELMILRLILDFELILECLRHLRMLGMRWIYFAYGEGHEFGERTEGRLLRVKLCPPLKCPEVLLPGPQDGIYLEIGLLQMQLIKINSLGWDSNPICLHKTELWTKTWILGEHQVSINSAVHKPRRESLDTSLTLSPQKKLTCWHLFQT